MTAPDESAVELADKRVGSQISGRQAVKPIVIKGPKRTSRGPLPASDVLLSSRRGYKKDLAEIGPLGFVATSRTAPGAIRYRGVRHRGMRRYLVRRKAGRPLDRPLVTFPLSSPLVLLLFNHFSALSAFALPTEAR
ncbi:MAG: hypothetical protein EA381_07545 [Planctomycetaceae bacterium]|nr:MAG: hypothetical protein EA381_07545 [Planctomycetaceae bacterium]